MLDRVDCRREMRVEFVFKYMIGGSLEKKREMCVFECVFLRIIIYEMCWWKIEKGGRFFGVEVLGGSEFFNMRFRI